MAEESVETSATSGNIYLCLLVQENQTGTNIHFKRIIYKEYQVLLMNVLLYTNKKKIICLM